MAAFDFAGYRRAVERLDVEQWASFYADDAEWIEYRESDPPRAPNVMRGRGAHPRLRPGHRGCRDPAGPGTRSRR